MERMSDKNLPRRYKIILGKTDDNHYHVPRLDDSTRGQLVVSNSEHEISHGHSFTSYYTRTTDATGGHRSAIYMLTPPGAPNINMIVSFSASTAAFFTICEGATVTIDHGTDNSPIYNRHRPKQATHTSACRDNATGHTLNVLSTFTEGEINGAGFAAGTVLRTEPLIAGGGPKPAGGVSVDTQKYILARDTPYIFLLTNDGAVVNIHHIMLDWFEHCAYED